MTRQEAKKQLNFGYALFFIGVLIGFVYRTNGIPPLAFGYIIWATYWGYRYLYKNLKLRLKTYIKETPFRMEADNVLDYFHKIHHYKWVTELFIFFICYVLGNFGIGIYMQYKLSKVAYF